MIDNLRVVARSESKIEDTTVGNGALLQRRSAPWLVLLDRNKSLSGSSHGATGVWTDVASSALETIALHHVALDSGHVVHGVVDGRLGIRVYALGDGFGYAILIEPVRNRQPLRDVAERYMLTRRESEVARWLLEGSSTAQIADMLSIAPSTVVIHIKRIMAKTGSRSRAEAVARIVCS